MARKIREHFTYANVMATIAVVLALGGVSYAATQLPPNSVGKEQLRRNSVTTEAIAKGAVRSGDIQDGSIDFKELVPGSALRAMFAHVSSSGTLREHSKPVESATRVSKGIYTVDFKRGLQGCVGVASVGFGFGPGVIGAGGTAQVSMNANNQPNRVKVTVYRKGYTFDDVEDNDIHLIVAC